MQDDVKLPPQEPAQPVASDMPQPMPQAPINDIVPTPAPVNEQGPLPEPEKRPPAEAERPEENPTVATTAAPSGNTHNVTAIVFAIIIMMALSAVAIYPALNK